jgi:hypothetical protein
LPLQAQNLLFFSRVQIIIGLFGITNLWCFAALFLELRVLTKPEFPIIGRMPSNVEAILRFQLISSASTLITVDWKLRVNHCRHFHGLFQKQVEPKRFLQRT